MTAGKITIMEKNGLHMRPAKRLCQTAAGYKSKVNIVSGQTITNAKSLLSVLGAGIRQGTEITVTCEGDDEEEAIEAVMSVLTSEL